MKYKVFIAKALAFGIILNSLSVLSYASTEIPNRYQTLEGEYITIDDSIEGNLEEIEIFGNTVQDENNLDDIQSVGDLYTDKDGNPILDSQGREQYKINITTTGKNLFDKDNIEVGGISHTTGENGNSTIDTRTIDYIKIKPSTKYVMSFKGTRDAFIYFYDSNKSFLNRVQVAGSGAVKISPSNAYYARIQYNTSDKTDIQFEEGDSATDYQPYYQSKTTILLPCQLQKVGNKADRLYWDNDRGRYVVEKNISNYTINGSARARRHTRYENHSKYQISVPNSGDYHGNFHPSLINGIVKGYPQQSNFNNSDTFGAGYYFEPSIGFGSAVFIKISNTVLDTNNESEIKSYLEANNLEVMYKGAQPQLIETNITSKLKIPTYDGKTHIYVDSQNGINPTLKVVVDRLPQIAKNSVEEAEVNSSLNNIALARMYTNMLPESLYKDQLQDQLSEIFSSDIVLDRKTATSNLDLYIKSENTLMMSLSTNSITFDDFSGVEDMVKENAVNISINSSLPYQLNAYLPTEIQNADKSNTMDKDILNIKENSENEYKTFDNTIDKVVLKDNNQAGNDLIHGIDIKLKGGIVHKKDVYKTTIKFEVEQK